MSSKHTTQLHIEWSPSGVQALNVVTGETASGSSLSEIRRFLEPHRHALVGIGRNAVFLKTLRMPKATPEDMRRILSVQAGQLFPLPSEMLSFDFVQSADQNLEGCLTLIAAMKTEDLKQVRAELQQVGLTATRILPVSLGAVAVVAKAGLKDGILLEKSSTGFTFDVVQGETVRFSRVVFGNVDPLAEVQRTLLASNATELPVVAASKLEIGGAVSTSSSVLGSLHEAPAFAFELAEFRAKAAKQHLATRNRVAALMLVSSLLLVGLVWDGRSKQWAIAKRGEGAWAKEISKLKSIKSFETTKSQKLSTMQMTLKGAFEPGQRLTDAMAVMADNVPTNAWITGVTLERGKAIQVRGMAKSAQDVATLVESLGRIPRFRDTRLIFANSVKIDDIPLVQFSATAIGVGNLPMPAPAKLTKKATKPAPKEGEPATGTGQQS